MISTTFDLLERMRDGAGTKLDVRRTFHGGIRAK